MGTTLEAVDRSKFGGGEVVGAVLSGGYFRGASDDLEYVRKELEKSALGNFPGTYGGYDICSSDDMCDEN